MFDWLKKRVPKTAEGAPHVQSVVAHVFRVDNADGTMSSFLSLLTPDVGSDRRLPSQAILGELVGGDTEIDPERFIPNPNFIEFMQSVIAGTLTRCPSVLAEAARQREGHVYIVDRRSCQPDGSVPARDVIGSIEVHQGRPRAYRPSPDHELLTEDGVMQLDPWFHARLVEALRRL